MEGKGAVPRQTVTCTRVGCDARCLPRGYACPRGPELRRFWLGSLPQSLTLREKTHLLLLSSNLGILFEGLSLLLTLVACADFVLSTYNTDIDKSPVLRAVYVVFFGGDFALNLWATPFRASFLVSWVALVDLCTVIPLVIELSLSSASAVSTFRALRALRALRLLRAFRMLRETFSPLTKAFLRVGIAIFCALFIFASFYNVVENTQYVTFTGATNAKAPTFGDALYLGIVTIATVGYGDVIPSTWASKLLVVLLVLVAAFIVPIQVDKIGCALPRVYLIARPTV
jgi:voltage-gated potassium channel